MSRDKAKYALDQILQHLGRSMDPSLWRSAACLDSRSGDRVFQEEKLAVIEMLALLEDRRSRIPPEALYAVLGELIRADRDLAEKAIKNALSGNPARLDQARQELSAANAEAEAGDYIDAIEHYRNSWNNAVRAMTTA